MKKIIIFLFFIVFQSLYTNAIENNNPESLLSGFSGNTIIPFSKGSENCSRIGIYLEHVETEKSNIVWMKPGEDSLTIEQDTDSFLVVSFYSESMYENNSFLYDMNYRHDKKELQLIIHPYGVSNPRAELGTVTFYKHKYYIHKGYSYTYSNKPIVNIRSIDVGNL